MYESIQLDQIVGFSGKNGQKKEETGADSAATPILKSHTCISKPNESTSILVVDDDPFNIQVFRSFMDKLEHKNVQYGKNGIDAVNLFKDSLEVDAAPVSLIFIDYDMPQMNGLEAATIIRQYEYLRKMIPCKIVMVSGHCSRDIIDRALDPKGPYKINRFLKKPIRFDQILGIIERKGRNKG